MTTPQIIAHRGASYLAPENTLVAFRKAMEIGADGVEMDVQKTYDNELVIHHDYMVDMHTDISGQIYDLTMGELKALDFGSWKDAIYANERIATLQEALELCAGMEGTQVQLELKSPLEDDPDFVPRVLDAVRAAGLTDRLTLISFHHSQLRQAKQLMPELKVGALTYGAFLSMVLPPPVVWKDLGLVNSMDEPFSEETASTCGIISSTALWPTRSICSVPTSPARPWSRSSAIWRSRQMWLPTSKRWISLWTSSAASTTPPTPTPIS